MVLISTKVNALLQAFLCVVAHTFADSPTVCGTPKFGMAGRRSKGTKREKLK
jgi:hypothetical protein